MPKLYEDDLRNDIAGTLAARTPGVSAFDNSVGMGLQNVGNRFAQPTGLGNTANTAVPQIGGAGGSFMPAGGSYMPPVGTAPGLGAAPSLGAMPAMGTMPAAGAMPGLPQLPGLNQQQRRRKM